MTQGIFAPRRLVWACLVWLGLIGSAFADPFVTVGTGCAFTDLQSAINAGTADEIHVVSSYRGKPIKFQNRSLRIYGAYTDCSGTTQLPFNHDLGIYSALDGSLDSGTKPVLQMDGSASLDLRFFVLENAHNSGNAGGGIRFFSSGASGHIELHNVEVINNRSDIGGGIFYNGGANGSDTLVLYDESLINNNTADHAGGGIRLEGHARLIAESPQTQIASNTANPDFTDDGKGGGLQVLDESSASIGSPGYNGEPVIYLNSARDGGGIAIHDLSVVRLYTTQSGQPARVESNRAQVNGGGIYLFPKNQNGALIPTLCGYGYGINHNSAADGAAIYADEDDSFGSITVGDRVFLTKDSCGGLPANAAQCINGTVCNTIDDNTATQQGGSIVFGHGEAQTELNAEDLELRRNSASYIVKYSGDSTFDVTLRDCLIADNPESSLLIWVDSGLLANIDSCTMTNNAPGAVELILDHGSLEHSIVWQPDASSLLLQGTGTIDVVDVIANTIDFEGAAPGQYVNVNTFDPLFINPSAGNYHLQSASPAIDYATSGIQTDLDGDARGIVVRNAATPFDVGVYERQRLSAPTFPPTETFDEGDPTAPELPPGWINTVFNDTGFTLGWMLANDVIFDGPFAAHADDPDGVTDSTLDTPPFDVGRNTQVSFYQAFNLESSGGAYYDGVVLEISIAGEPFQDILDAGGAFVAGSYTGVISGNFSSPIANRSAWSGDSAGYQPVIVALPAAAAGQSIRLRWRLASDASNNGAGYWLDDINVVDIVDSDEIFADDFDGP